jgi:hypothetical protein
VPSPRPAAGGGLVVSVAPERLERWLRGFSERHDGGTEPGGLGEPPGPRPGTAGGTGPAPPARAAPDVVILTGRDGARAEVQVPFPPLPDTGDPVPALVAHALVDRRVGLLLVRLGGHACGVVEGSRLVVSKVGSRPVHGRSAAGGRSQQRFARRREGQVRVALQAAADTAARLLVPEAARLDAVVLGGDRSAVDAVLADRRLAALQPLLTGRLLDVPDPRQAVLDRSARTYREVRIRVVEPP